MTAAVGHPTLRLVRIAIGPITLEGLEPGQWDAITPEERRELRAGLTGLRRAANRSGAGRRAPRRRSRR
jgi:23S rRNA pseudouridine2457 synthase